MYPYHSLVALCLASSSAAAVFTRRGSANAISGAPFANTTTVEAPVVPVSSSIDSASTSSLIDHDQINQPPVSSVDDSVAAAVASTQYVPVPSAIVVSVESSFHPTLDNATSLSQLVPPEAPSSSSTVPSLSLPVETPLSDYDNATALTPLSVNATSIRQASNATCTVNIPSASIDYWFAPTLSHVIGTMTTSAFNFSNRRSYTLVPNTQTFDVTSALASDYIFTTSTTVVPAWDWTGIVSVDYSIRPTAAATSIVSRSVYTPFPSGGVIPMSDALLYDLFYGDRTEASVEMTLAPNATRTQTSATPFVIVTAYEVETGNKTETVQLPSPQAYPYWLKGVEDAPSATGPLPTGFMDEIPQSACDPGQLQASVTVLIVVDLYYQNFPDSDPLFVHFESSVDGFGDETVGVQGTLRGVEPLTVSDWALTDIQPNVRASPTASPGNSDIIMFNAGGKPSQIEDMPPEPTRVTIGTIGTNPVVVLPSSQVVVGSQTLRPGAPPITVDGKTPVSLVPSATAIVVGGTTSELPQVFNPAPQPGVRPPPILTIGSSTLVPNAATQFFVAPGQTLTPGGVVTLDGTVVSLAPSASFVVVGGTTQVFPVTVPVVPAATQPPQIVVGGSTITAEPSRGDPGNAAPMPTFVVSGQTLAPGSAITVAGTILSLPPSGSVIVVNGVTSALNNGASPATAPPLTIGNMVFTGLPGSKPAYVISSMLLTPGGSIVVAGTTISLSPGATALVVNGQTSMVTVPQPIVTNAPVLTIGSQTYTAAPGSGTTFVVSGRTLTPGGTITVDGTTIVLSPGATELVYGSSGSSTTTALFPATTTRSQEVTGTSNPSAGASGNDRQPTATSSRQGSGAILSHASQVRALLYSFLPVVGFLLA